MRNCGVIIAARMGSRRLPGKAMLPLKGMPMISFLIKRLKSSKKMSNLVLATTSLQEDDILAKTAEDDGVTVFRGNRDDVVKRFVEAAAAFNLSHVVRVTGDCPFVDGDSLDYCLEKCDRLSEFDLVTTKGRFPIGIDFEIYKAETMAILHKKKLTSNEREHLTLPIYNRKEIFKIFLINPPVNWPATSAIFTVDTDKDYRFAKILLRSFQDIHSDIPTLLEQSTLTLARKEEA